MPDPTVQRVEDEFREASTEALYSSSAPQKAIADLNKVQQSTISRWLSYTGDTPLPAFRILLLPHDIAFPILKFLANKFDMVLLPRNPTKGQLDGQIADEALSLAESVGKLAGEAQQGRLDRKKCREILEAIIVKASKGLDELNALEGGKIHSLPKS